MDRSHQQSALVGVKRRSSLNQGLASLSVRKDEDQDQGIECLISEGYSAILRSNVESLPEREFSKNGREKSVQNIKYLPRNAGKASGDKEVAKRVHIRPGIAGKFCLNIEEAQVDAIINEAAHEAFQAKQRCGGERILEDTIAALNLPEEHEV